MVQFIGLCAIIAFLYFTVTQFPFFWLAIGISVAVVGLLTHLPPITITGTFIVTLTLAVSLLQVFKRKRSNLNHKFERKGFFKSRYAK